MPRHPSRCPAQPRTTGEFGSIVAYYRLRCGWLDREPLKFAHHPYPAQGGVDHRRQALATEVVDDAQDAEAAAVAQGVGDEVERPALDDSDRQRHRCSRTYCPLSPSTPAHHQPLFPVQSIQLLVVQRIAFARQHPAQAPIPEAPPLRGQLPQSLPQCRVVRSSAPVTQSRTIQPHHLARVPLTQPVTLHYPNHCYSPRRRLQPFFPSRSLSAALSNNEPANSRFRRLFSSSSAFSRLASETSSPPYFDFHL